MPLPRTRPSQLTSFTSTNGFIQMFGEHSLSVAPLAVQSFAAEAYACSPVYGPLSLPWYADYLHLVFWFLFLNVLVLCVWLAQAFALLTRGGEARFPIRETRGFSRAQTGDTLTAIIPMA